MKFRYIRRLAKLTINQVRCVPLVRRITPANTGYVWANAPFDIIIIGLNEPHLTPLYSEYSHLVYAASGADVDTVIINGKVVMEKLKLLTINEEEVMQKVREIAVKVKQSLKK